jgi:glycosyltransferase involved in cell wall biosynthesis
MVTVSIIVPCYHSARFIERALNSFEAQTFKDFEIICVIDDVDFDNTVEIIENHYLKFMIRMFATTNKTSPAKARNTGIKHARGKYVAFCDSDDWWEPTKLEEQVLALDFPFLDLSYTLTEIHHLDGTTHIAGENYSKSNLRWKNMAPHSSVMVKKWVATKFPFNENMKAIDDQEWLHRLDDEYYHMELIPKVLTHAEVWGGNLTNDNKSCFKQNLNMHFARGEYYTGLYKYIVWQIIPTLVELKGKFFIKGTWRLNK